jgi:hypothetical protein
MLLPTQVNTALRVVCLICIACIAWAGHDEASGAHP